MAALARRAHRERLARAVREKGKDNVEGAEEDEVCVICLGEPVNPVRLPCGHKYCKTCVEELAAKGVSKKCPLCRKPLPPNPEKLFDLGERMYGLSLIHI